LREGIFAGEEKDKKATTIVKKKNLRAFRGRKGVREEGMTINNSVLSGGT